MKSFSVDIKGNLIPFPDERSRAYHPEETLIGEGESTQRSIFGSRFGDVALTPFEQFRLEELENSWGNNGDPTIDCDDIEETQKLRFLQGCGWNVAQAAEALRRYVEFRQQLGFPSDIPANRNDPDTWFYFHGRDICLRPILILSIKKLLNREKLPERAEVEHVMIDGMRFFERHLVVPGRVEQLLAIVDLDGCSAWDLPIEDLKCCMNTLTSLFRARLNKLFVINSPFIFYALWGIMQSFLPARTVAKVSILRADYHQDVL
jgi:hypothetical protein